MLYLLIGLLYVFFMPAARLCPCAPRIFSAAHSRNPFLQCAKNASCIFTEKILRRSGRSQRQKKNIEQTNSNHSVWNYGVSSV